ncbi:transposase [Lactiplantibacillus plantarum]|nr:transposase [Lactiplantibacillus plantarum]
MSRTICLTRISTWTHLTRCGYPTLLNWLMGSYGEHKIRLGGVMDLYDRRILAYNLSITETSAAEIQVFQRAFATARNVHPMIHTDRGSAYTSGAFNHYLPANLRSHAVCHVPGHHMTMRQWNVGVMNLNYVGW